MITNLLSAAEYILREDLPWPTSMEWDDEDYGDLAFEWVLPEGRARIIWNVRRRRPLEFFVFADPAPFGRMTLSATLVWIRG